jgi:hypothetical protein
VQPLIADLGVTLPKLGPDIREAVSGHEDTSG